MEGNSPKDVEKLFGPGNYDLVKQMSADAMETLRGIADVTGRSLKAQGQASAGQTALREILEANSPFNKFKIPTMLNTKAMAANRALDLAEKKIGKKTMNILAEALKSGRSADELMSLMPAKERVNLLRVMNDPSLWAPGASGAGVNALSEVRQ